MFKVNENYLKLPGSYLFSTIGKKVRAYKEENPEKEVISLIGNVEMLVLFIQEKNGFYTFRLLEKYLKWIFLNLIISSVLTQDYVKL